MPRGPRPRDRRFARPRRRRRAGSCGRSPGRSARRGAAGARLRARRRRACTALSASCIASRCASVAPETQRPVDVEQQQQLPVSARTTSPAPAGLRERRDQPRGGVDVVDRDELDRRVHVAQRNRDEPGRDARAAQVDRVGVGARPAAERLDRERDLLAARPARRAARTPAGAGSCPRAITGPDPSLCSVIVAELDPRLVGREGHVDDDRHVRLVREGAGPGAGEASSPPGRPPSPARRRARRRPRPPGAPPRRRRSSRRDCRARARRRCRGADSIGSTSITATSPIRTSPRASSPSLAPMSMCSSFSSGTFLRSSSLSRWIGLRAITPITGPRRGCACAPAARPARSRPSRRPRRSAGSRRRRCARCAARSRRCARRSRAVGPPAVAGHAGKRGADVVGADVLGELGAALAPHARGVGLVTGGAGGRQEAGEELWSARAKGYFDGSPQHHAPRAAVRA